ncbi:metabotropic glutamate receptor 2-like protein [Leptotrombidium deliense]|uniref:Metabotropic glutamate receptor 2-like protein n=1 Tax=Leptotrombidium deliense TaxID=299467 RepID=A0A443SQP1_9ACAR|nr:metabotropic glutamate receptor 2-like protein [Leptotrombidium deliense]
MENVMKPILVSVQNYDPFSNFQNSSICGDAKCSGNERIDSDTVVEYETNNSLNLETERRIVYESSTELFKMRTEPWVPYLFGLSTMNLSLIVVFEMFVIYKAVKTVPSRRHLFLGQVLLLGLCMSSSIGFSFVPEANWISCTVIRVGLGLGYATIFGTLLVKTVFLLSLHSGIYLPIVYQAFLLFFILLTQIVIDVQWLLHSTPAVIDITERDISGAVFNQNNHSLFTRVACNHNIPSIVYSMSYNALLIIIVSFVSLRIKGHRENFREALFICISITGTIIIWVIWCLGALLSTQNTAEAFVAYGTVLNSSFVFVVMFVPKARQLSSLRRECRFLRDHRRDTDSPDSLYSPSFVHVKPLMASNSNSNWNLYQRFNYRVCPRNYYEPKAVIPSFTVLVVFMSLRSQF